MQRRIKELELELEVSKLRDRVADLERKLVETSAEAQSSQVKLSEMQGELAKCREEKGGKGGSGMDPEKRAKLQQLRDEEKRKKEEAKRRRAEKEKARAEKEKARGGPEPSGAKKPPQGAEAAKTGTGGAKSKGSKKKKRPNPAGIEDELFCEGCKAVIDNMGKALKKAEVSRSKAGSMAESMEKLCDISSFPTYNYAPPKMQKACEAILSDYDEYLESIFEGTRDVGPDRHQHFCFDYTGACVGVDKDFQPQPTVTIDGQPVAVGADGQVDPSHGPDGEEL